MNILLEKLIDRQLYNQFIELYNFLAAILDFSRHIEFQNWVEYQFWTPWPWKYYKSLKNYQYRWNNGRDIHHSNILATILVYGRHFEIEAKIQGCRIAYFEKKGHANKNPVRKVWRTLSLVFSGNWPVYNLSFECVEDSGSWKGSVGQAAPVIRIVYDPKNHNDPPEVQYRGPSSGVFRGHWAMLPFWPKLSFLA